MQKQVATFIIHLRAIRGMLISTFCLPLRTHQSQELHGCPCIFYGTVLSLLNGVTCRGQENVMLTVHSNNHGHGSKPPHAVDNVFITYRIYGLTMKLQRHGSEPRKKIEVYCNFSAVLYNSNTHNTRLYAG